MTNKRKTPILEDNDTSTMTAAEKIAAARARQTSNNYDELDTGITERKREINLVKHTETIDRLVVQNKQLQRDLSEADNEIDDLEKKLSESTIKISKNLFYIFIGCLGFAVYIVNGHLININTKIIEMNLTIKEYKGEIEKTKLFNEILEKKLNIEKK